MTREDFLEIAEQFKEESLGVLENKSSDYNGPDNDPLYNAKMARSFGIDPAQGLLVRILDKLNRVSSILQHKTIKIKDEKIKDTLIDLSNYTAMLYIYLKEQKDE